MIFLEIAMIVIGLSAIIYSFRMSSATSTDRSVKESGGAEDSQRESMRLQSLLDSFTTKAETICDNLEEKMSQLSNEKIIGISEYSDQVLDKIQKNHEEVVFLYEMMNEKQEEVKKLVHDVDVQKAELQDEAAKEYQKMKEQEQLLEEMKRNLETDYIQFQTEQSGFRKEFEQLREDYGYLEEEIEKSISRLQANAVQTNYETDFQQEFNSKNESSLNDINDDFRKLLEGDDFEKSFAEELDDDTFDSSVFDAEIARIEEEETKAMENGDMPETPVSFEVSSNYTPMSEQEQTGNHNDEIISLYKKGRSILEISKMLSLGQGEVKFVIDLYNAR